MKDLEDIKAERVIYDRIGDKEQTLLQERKEATKDDFKYKRKYKVERPEYKLDRNHQVKLSTSLDV